VALYDYIIPIYELAVTPRDDGKIESTLKNIRCPYESENTENNI